ncbi:MAG: amidophosphoribosyltransferase [Lachnospiraceae bacterium]
MSGLHEECGVYGIISTGRKEVAQLTYMGLFALQHRGQQSCGIAVNDDGVFRLRKELGLVSEVFDDNAIRELGQGNMAVGHVLYGMGASNRANCQPLDVRHIKGRLVLANNGTLTNATELRTGLELQGSIFTSSSNAELIAHTITRARLASPSIEVAVSAAMNSLEGAYSLVMLSPRKLIAVRDPHGLKPMCYGRTEEGDYVVASESCALNATGAEFIRDIEPGEIVVFSKDGITSIRDHCGKKEKNLCVFEYVYFARPDSRVDGVSVHLARKQAGRILAQERPVDADVVVGVPDSGLDAAVGYAEHSGIPYGIGLIKNRYIARTFISPGQTSRENKVRLKLNPVESVVNGKRVILIDDSIIRGTTSKRLVSLLRAVGAKEVHMRISSPPFIHACYYGVDTGPEDKLISCKYSPEEIAEIIGADSLGFMSLEGVKSLGGDGHCCTACFDGKYPTTILTQPYTDRFERKLSERV